MEDVLGRLLVPRTGSTVVVPTARAPHLVQVSTCRMCLGCRRVGSAKPQRLPATADALAARAQRRHVSQMLLSRVTFLEAAEEILRKARRPLTVEEITAKALERGLIRSSGKTPTATMSAALYRAPADTGIRRVAQTGRVRAKRGSVRWVYASKR